MSSKILSSHFSLQEQYVFIHDAVFESVTCGNTQIPGWELSGTTSRLGQVSAHTGKSGFQHQFEVHIICT